MLRVRSNTVGKINKVLSVKNLFQRPALVFLCLLLVFSLTMPTQVGAWSLFGDGKKQPSILPAQEVDIRKTQATEGVVSNDTRLGEKTDHSILREDESHRTAFTSTYTNKDGTKTLRYSSNQMNYKKVLSGKK